MRVELVSETETISTTALLDSGATLSFIPYEIAEILDVIPQEQTPIDVETAGGPSHFFPVRLKKLSVFAGGEILSDFIHPTVLVPTDRGNDLPYAILGRDLFFKRFHITFMEKRKKVRLIHHKWIK
jgi:hypothetical protein